MNDFIFEAGTKVIFGRGQILDLGEETRRFGRNALLVYGGGSIKIGGVYNTVLAILNDARVNITELSGVEPNPKIQSVRDGVKLCRDNNIEVIVAVGGGSVIDCSKAIAASVDYDGDPLDFITGKARPKSALPIIVVLTIAATGSEVDAVAVISDPELKIKNVMAHPGMRPKVAILDPAYSFSVNKFQTASGTADILSHAMENYFWHDEGAFLQDSICEAIMKTCVKYGPIACEDMVNYEARANLMWAASLAMIGLTSCGKQHGWSVHTIEHQLSAYYDIPHGVGLAILTPVWMERVLSEETAPKFADFAVNVFGVARDENVMTTARAGIAALRAFLASMDIADKLSDVGIEDESNFAAMAKAAAAGGLSRAYVPLTETDVLELLKACK